MHAGASETADSGSRHGMGAWDYESAMKISIALRLKSSWWSVSSEQLLVTSSTSEFLNLNFFILIIRVSIVIFSESSCPIIGVIIICGVITLIGLWKKGVNCGENFTVDLRFVGKCSIGPILSLVPKLRKQIIFNWWDNKSCSYFRISVDNWASWAI